jgi:hypothetical protein
MTDKALAMPNAAEEVSEEKMNKRLKLHLMIGLLLAGAACGPEGCCAPPVQAGTGITVVNGAVRACDLVFQVPGDEMPKVEFGAAVKGAAVPKAPNVGVSFVAQSDASLEGQDLGRLVFSAPGQVGELVSSSCYDAQGAPVAGDVVRLSD